MARRDMLTVFCCDIASDKVRQRVSRVLEDAAVRVQRGVFEARLSEAEADRLATRLAALLAPDDSLRVYAVGHDGLRRSRAYGPLPLPEESDFYLL